MPEEMAGFEQCFLTGTAAEVTPVSEIGPYRFTVGEITKTLMDDYMAAVRPAVPSPAKKRAAAALRRDANTFVTARPFSAGICHHSAVRRWLFSRQVLSRRSG